MSSPQGISIHIGLNSVDPSHYEDEFGNPWPGELAGCEFDARDMYDLASGKGFAAELILTESANSERVLSRLNAAAQELSKGDILFVTYSGHGGQVPDMGDEEEDKRDETWCLFDRELIDDELFAVWSGIPAGVRVVVLSDSCHSGSVTRLYFRSANELERRIVPASGPGELPRDRAMPPGVQGGTFKKNRTMYEQIQAATPQVESSDLDASVLLISGCQDNQLSADGDRNGLFTQNVRTVWANGAFSGSYADFHKKVLHLMPDNQSPNYFLIGQRNYLFEGQQAFSI